MLLRGFLYSANQKKGTSIGGVFTKNILNKMKKESNVERFYAWMLKINSIHLADNVKMAAAFHKIATS